MGRVNNDGCEHYDVVLTDERADRLRALAEAAGSSPGELLAFAVNSWLDGEADCGD